MTFEPTEQFFVNIVSAEADIPGDDLNIDDCIVDEQEIEPSRQRYSYALRLTTSRCGRRTFRMSFFTLTRQAIRLTRSQLGATATHL